MPLLHGKLSKTPPERFLICLAKRSRARTMLQVVLRVTERSELAVARVGRRQGPAVAASEGASST